MGEGPRDLAAQVCEGIPRHGHVVYIGDGYPGDVEAPSSGIGREAGLVLLPAEPLLLDRGDDLAIDQQRGRGIAVIGVEPQDDHSDIPPGEDGLPNSKAAPDRPRWANNQS